MNKRYEVQGPFRRLRKQPYWVVLDTHGKHVVSQHSRRGDAFAEARRLESA